jgi:hypothetical protein
MNIEILDKRFNKTKRYLNTKKGSPVYKKRGFKNIDKILGPQYKWIDKAPLEYFSLDPTKEALIAINLFNFKEEKSFRDLRDTYINLSRLMHPDNGGHSSAFDIINHAYNFFKIIRHKKRINRKA